MTANLRDVLLQRPTKSSSCEPVTFFRHKDGWCRRSGRCRRKVSAPTTALSRGNSPTLYNDPLLFVIPSEAEESAVRHSGAPDLQVYNYLPFVILRACGTFEAKHPKQV